MKLSSYLILIMLIFGQSLVAQDKISIETSVDRQEITIGDRIWYTVKITADTLLQIDSLVVGDRLGMFEIKDYRPEEIHFSNQFKVITQGFQITTFTTGEYKIPPLKIKYSTPAGDQRQIESDPISINIKSLLSGEDGEDIRPLKAQKSFESEIPFWYWIVGAFLLLGIALFIYLYRRARKPIELMNKVIDTRLPWEITLENLQNLADEQLPAKGEIKLYYLKLSEIFRDYLERRFGIGALERTTFEIITEFRQLSLSNNDETVICDFLEDCDLVKFAKHKPTQEDYDLDFNRAKDFVLETRTLPHSSVRSQ